MKKLYFLLISATGTFTFSQTIITKTANDYLAGNTVNNVNLLGTPDNSVTGYPKTFNNSTLSAGAAITGSVSTPSAAEIVTFPGSTVKFSDGGGNDIFYKSSAADLQITGATIGGAVLNFISNNALFLKFPTAYSNTYTDTASGTGIYGTTNAYFSGNITTNADAAGTLLLGATTYTNVIRVKTFQDYKLYLDAGLTFQVGTLTSTIYTYYDNVRRYPIFTSTTATVKVPLASIDQTTDAAVGQITPVLATGNNDAKNKIQVYPNPVKDHLFIAGDLANYSGIKIFSLEGKLVKTISAKEDKIDLSDLPAGNYILELTSATEKSKSIQILKK